MDELARALAFDRQLRARAAQETSKFDAGVALRHHGLPVVHHLNAVMLDAPLPEALDAAPIVALADRHLDGLGHRRIVLDDAHAAQRISAALLDVGWSRERTRFMIWRESSTAQLRRDDRAREISEAELRELQLALFADDRGVELGGSVIQALVDAQAALRAANPALRFGAGEHGRLASSATLFLDGSAGQTGGIAMIEEVGTLTAERRRGLGNSVVLAALLAARDAGRDPIVIPADADDWPQLMYAKLGFEPVGEQISFTLRSPVASSEHERGPRSPH